MYVEIFTLCDFVQESNNKLNIIGTFDQIMSHNFPAVHPQCGIAGRLRFTRVETGRHNIRVLFVNQDGRDFIPQVSADVDVAVPEGTGSVIVNLAINIGTLTFTGAGAYSINLAVDGREMASLPLNIVQIPAHTGG